MRTCRITVKWMSMTMGVWPVLLFTLPACTAVPRGMPTGEWSGQGIYVDYEAVGRGKLTDSTQSRDMNDTYETSLKIRQRQIYGHDAMLFDIQSKRGKLLNLDDDESHVRFLLVPLKSLEHGAELYAVAHWEYNPSKESQVSEEEFNKQIRVAAASCVRKDGATVLQIDYIAPSEDDPICFTDCFVFDGRRLSKVGHVIKTEAAQKEKKPAEVRLVKVCWVETLRKTR